MTLVLMFLLINLNIDESIMNSVNHTLKSEFSNTLFTTLSRSSDGEVLALSLVGYAALGGSQAQKHVKALALTAIPTSLIVQGAKLATRRWRPDSSNRKSLPSGHAASAFLFAEFFSEKYPGLRLPLYLWAFGVGLSRIYLERHWPSDVIVGAALGVIAARVGLRYEDELLRFKLFP